MLRVIEVNIGDKKGACYKVENFFSLTLNAEDFKLEMLSLTNCSNDELLMIMECFEVSCGFKDPPDWKITTISKILTI